MWMHCGPHYLPGSISSTVVIIVIVVVVVDQLGSIRDSTTTISMAVCLSGNGVGHIDDVSLHPA